MRRLQTSSMQDVVCCFLILQTKTFREWSIYKLVANAHDFCKYTNGGHGVKFSARKRNFPFLHDDVKSQVRLPGDKRSFQVRVHLYIKWWIQRVKTGKARGVSNTKMSHLLRLEQYKIKSNVGWPVKSIYFYGFQFNPFQTEKVHRRTCHDKALIIRKKEIQWSKIKEESFQRLKWHLHEYVWKLNVRDDYFYLWKFH